MKTTILVPVDFTPVSHNALKYACELSLTQPCDIVAVHLLDNKLLTEVHDLPDYTDAMKQVVARMHDENVQKTTADLTNFVLDLKEKYGVTVRPHISPGSIYEAFNDIAARYDSSVIVMGTHGITGMQHLSGSRAYKVVVNTPHPFLIVQNKRYKAIKKIYCAFRNGAQFREYAGMLARLSPYFTSAYIINIMSCDTETVPPELQHLAGSITFSNRNLQHVNVIACATTEGAEAVCIVINEIDNLDGDTYGMTQDRILGNRHELPVLCLPQW